MLKKLITLSLILVVFLAACQSASSSPTTLPSAQVEPGQGGEEAPDTQPPPLPEVSPTPSTEQTVNQGDANCTVVSSGSSPDPAEDSIVPLVSESDWAHGPEDANVTIIEYGDFQ